MDNANFQYLKFNGDKLIKISTITANNDRYEMKCY